MTMVYRARCNNCGQETESAGSYAPIYGWHRYNFQDIRLANFPVDICPDCWPHALFSTIAAEIPEAVITSA